MAPEQVLIPAEKKARPWWEKVDTRYLLRRLRTSTDRIELAAVLVELADRAERNHILQETLSKIQLRPPLNVFEYRKPRNRKGFWARIPYTREHPTEPQLMAKLEFSETSYSLFGERGRVERPDGTQIARAPYLLGERMRGRTFVDEEARIEKKRQRAIERIALVQ